jgi:hypothetical protein
MELGGRAPLRVRRPGGRSRLLGVLLALTVVVIGVVVAGSPAGAVDLDPCNNDDAPIPASPHGAGSWIVQLGESPKDADPFDDDGVTLESTYGTTPQLWTYDNGCTGQFVAGAGTAIGNILLQVSGAIPNWTHALLAAVVDPDSPVRALDNPVVDATRAVTDGVWRPWITIAVLLVAATAIWRARTGHIAGSATAVAWAGVVLLGTTLLISYPAESVRLVDDGVRNTVTLIATGFEDHPAPGEDPAVAAINGQMDEVVRSTQYRTWLTGALGDADSATAREYGPGLFRATHFTFDEYETYRSDPKGEGKAIVEEKQDAFKTIADQIDREDSVAYVYFKGEHWGQRATAGLINLVAVIVTCGYLLIAGLAILLAFVLIRLIVPLAPAAGILFIFDRTRDLATSRDRPTGHGADLLRPGPVPAPILQRRPDQRPGALHPQAGHLRSPHLPRLALHPTRCLRDRARLGRCRVRLGHGHRLASPSHSLPRTGTTNTAGRHRPYAPTARGGPTSSGSPPSRHHEASGAQLH